MRVFLTITAAVALTIGGAGQAWAQGSNSSGTFGPRTTGGSLGPGNRTFSSGATTSSNATSAGQITGRERFLRQNHQAGQFVGTDAADAAYALRNFSVFSTTGVTRQQQNLAAARGALQAAQAQAGQANSAPPFQAAIEAAFTYPAVSAQQVSQSLAHRVEGMHGIKAVKPIHVAVQGDTAILRGEVGSQHDRALMEQMARLEPGVRKVQNELTVAPPKSEPSKPR